MAKGDPTRNYYADLNISPNADDNEIRKAFRTLALQYHPDRNPGREAEFVVKFQEIQAAHEVLCDATQRAIYDAERRKFRNLNPAATSSASSTPRRPAPPRRDAPTTSTPSGSYYRAPPPKPFPHQHQPQAPPQPQPQRPPPPQHHSTYTTGADRFSSKNFRPPPTAQRPDARDKAADGPANVFTAWQKMKPPRAEEPRSTSSGAQQNNPNGQPFGRTQSARAPASKKGFDPGTLGGDEGQARSAYRSSYGRPTPTPPSPTKDAPASDVPFSEANRTRTPYYSTASGERTSMFEGVHRPASMRNSPSSPHRPSPSPHRPSPSADADPYLHSDSARRQPRSSSRARPKSYPHVYPDSSDDEAAAGTPHRSQQPPPPPPRQPAQPGWAQGVFSTPQPSRQSSGGPGNASGAFKSRSEESINMKFSPSDWHGKFEGNADYFAPNMRKGPSNKAHASPTRSKPPPRPASERPAASSQPTKPPFVPPLDQRYFPPPPPGPPPGSASFAPPEFPAAAHPTKFSPQAWAESFKEPSWVLSGTDPRRASDASKRPKPTRKPSVPQSGASKTHDQADPWRSRHQPFAEDADAMDIDSSTPSAPSTTSSTARARASTTSAAGMATAPGAKDSAGAPPFVDATLPVFGSNGTARGTGQNDSTRPPSFVAATLPTFGLNGVAGIAKVEPFVPPQNGGLGMGELGDTLPHRPQASSTHPMKPSSAQSLKFPDIPAAPQPPKKIDRDSTDAYFVQFERYIKAYIQLSKDISTHFNARNAQLQDLDDHFVRNRGETTKKLGFASYLARMREDEKVIATWGVAQGKHILALEQCEAVRNKTIKMYLPHS